MYEFRFRIIHELDLSYTLEGDGALAKCSMTIQFKDLFTEGPVHTGIVIESSLATFPEGSGIRVTRKCNEAFIKDSF